MSNSLGRIIGQEQRPQQPHMQDEHVSQRTRLSRQVDADSHVRLAVLARKCCRESCRGQSDVAQCQLESTLVGEGLIAR